jgi:hypothetical protein
MDKLNPVPRGIGLDESTSGILKASLNSLMKEDDLKGAIESAKEKMAAQGLENLSNIANFESIQTTLNELVDAVTSKESLVKLSVTSIDSPDVIKNTMNQDGTSTNKNFEGGPVIRASLKPIISTGENEKVEIRTSIDYIHQTEKK